MTHWLAPGREARIPLVASMCDFSPLVMAFVATHARFVCRHHAALTADIIQIGKRQQG